MNQRTAEIVRTTNETDIRVAVNLDGAGATDIETGVPFFDHMLTAFGRHSLIDLDVRAKAISRWTRTTPWRTRASCWAKPLRVRSATSAASRGSGRFRFPWTRLSCWRPWDISGRGQLHWAVDVPCVMLGTFDASLAKEFFIAFAANAGLTLHVRSLAGENAHHIVEASFKAAARALRQAVELDPRIGDALPSTMGAL